MYLAWKSEGQSEGEENGEKVWFIASYLKLLCRLQLFHKLEKKMCCFHKLMYSSGDPHTAIMTLSSMFASDICLRSPRRNHVSTRARSLLVNAAQIFCQSSHFSTRALRTNHAAECLSRLCIDLTCKSLALNASFASGVNAPLE